MLSDAADSTQASSSETASLERVAVEQGGAEPEHRALRLGQRGAGGVACAGQRTSRVAGRVDRPLCLIQPQQDGRQAAADRVVDVAHHPLALRHDRGFARPVGGLGVQPRVRDRDAGVGREEFEQGRIRLGEFAHRVAAEQHAGADDGAVPADGNPDHAVQRSPVRAGDVPAAHLRVLVEDHGCPGTHHLAGHAFVERVGLAGLAADAEVDIFAVRAGDLVDRADGPGVAAEQLHGVAEDALQQRLEGEMPGQVVGHRGQRVELHPDAVGIASRAWNL